MKDFVLSYAHYRQLGFSELQALDFALSRPRVTPILAALVLRARRVQERRAALRLVK